MSKRTRYIIAVILTLAVVGFAVVAMWPTSPGVTHTNFDRIEYRMTLAEVEEIFGRPADHIDEFEDLRICGWSIAPDGNVLADENVVLWISPEGVYRRRWSGREGFVSKFRRWFVGPPDEFFAPLKNISSPN